MLEVFFLTLCLLFGTEYCYTVFTFALSVPNKTIVIIIIKRPRHFLSKILNTNFKNVNRNWCIILEKHTTSVRQFD